jgi:hypothetical protein
MKTPYANIPPISLWEAIGKRNKVLLLLNWATEPISLDEIRDIVYPGGGDIKRRRIMTLLSELKSQGLVEAPERGCWIGVGE